MSQTVKHLTEQLPCKGLFFDIEGHAAFLMTPSKETASRPTPWVWYAPTFLDNHPNDSHAWMFLRFLQRGIAIAGVEVGESFGNPEGRRIYTAFYDRLCTQYGLSARACILPQSRGGLMLYNWAAENAQRVACVAGIYTVCDVRSYPGIERACHAYRMRADELAACLSAHNPIDRLAPLAEANVPIFHIHGDNDTVVPLEQNAGALARRYRQLGGKIKLRVVPGRGHEVVPEFFECPALVDFVLENAN